MQSTLDPKSTKQTTSPSSPPSIFFFSLLRISAAQLLRHAGITGSRPSVLDAFADLMARYLQLLGSTAKDITESSNRTTSELIDALSAMEHVGLLQPLTIFQPDYDHDTRAVDSFIEWAKSAEVEELRRVAGVVTVEVSTAENTAPMVNGSSGAGGQHQIPDVASMATGIPSLSKPTTVTTTLRGKSAPIPTTTTTAPNTPFPISKPTPPPATEVPGEEKAGTPSVSTTPQPMITDTPIKRESVEVEDSVMMMDVVDMIPPDLDDDENANNNEIIIKQQAEREEEEEQPRVRLKQLDWFAALRNKEPKAEDAERFRGSLLGGEVTAKMMGIEGGDSVEIAL